LIRVAIGFVKALKQVAAANAAVPAGLQGKNRMTEMNGPSVEYLDGTERQKDRSYSPAIITRGGKIVWLAGQTATTDIDGKPIADDFEAQVRTCFELLRRTLRRAGGDLENLVTMTVFITDPRRGDEFVAIRKQIFRKGKYPCSALLTISGFASPGMLIEIQGVAVIPE
jgi:2-iminobutanoate/2-iminopropanoate deaminase